MGESARRGLSPQKNVPSVKLSFSLAWVCKPRSRSYISLPAVKIVNQIQGHVGFEKLFD